MVNDATFISQSLVDHLFYLRSIREFCLNIQLSFYQNSDNIIEIAEGLGKRYEELATEAISLANGRIPNQILVSNSFVTDFTLNTEIVTENLFGVDINTNLTTEEMNLNGYDNTNELKFDNTIVERVSNLNKNAIELTQNFINFCEYLNDSIKKIEILSRSYPLIYTYMIGEASLYLNDLERWQERNSADPTYVVNFEYYFSNSMVRASQFIIGLSDPNQTYIITNADNYRKLFSNLMKEYQEIQLSPDTLKVLNEEGINLVENFIAFLKKIITGILNQNYYFIVEPVFFDNLLTEANYFLYLLKGADYGIRKKDSNY